MTGKKGSTHYALEIKLEAVRLFLEEGRTRAEVAKMLGLRSKKRVEVWVRQYRHEVDAFRKPIGRPRKVAESVQDELKRLRMENDLLKKFQAELRNEELAKLPPRALSIFRQHRIDGRTQREIAAALGLSASTIESDLRIVYRLLAELKEKLDEE